MEIIKVIFGSNIQGLEEERNIIFQFAAEINKKLLPNIYIKIIELNANLSDLKTVEELTLNQDLLSECNAVFFVVNKMLSAQTRREFDEVKAFFLAHNKPRIIVLFKMFETLSKLSKEAQNFETYLREDLAYYYDQYDHVSQLKFRLMFEMVINSPSLEITCKKGDFYLNDILINNHHNDAFYQDHQTLNKLKEQQHHLIDSLMKNPEDHHSALELEDINQMIQKLEEEIVKTLENFYKATGLQKVSPLMKQAMIYIKQGNIEKANEILSKDTLIQNAELAERRFNVKSKHLEEELKAYLRDLPYAASIKSQLNTELGLKEAKEILEKATEIEYNAGLEPEFHITYIEFLERYESIEEILPFARRAKKLLKTSSPNYGVLYLAINDFLMKYCMYQQDYNEFMHLKTESLSIINKIAPENKHRILKYLFSSYDLSIDVAYNMTNIDAVKQLIDKALQHIESAEQPLLIDYKISYLFKKIAVLIQQSELQDIAVTLKEVYALITKLEDAYSKDLHLFNYHLASYLFSKQSMLEEAIQKHHITTVDTTLITELYQRIQKKYSGKTYHIIHIKYLMVLSLSNFLDDESFAFNNYKKVFKAMFEAYKKYPLESYSFLITYQHIAQEIFMGFRDEDYLLESLKIYNEFLFCRTKFTEQENTFEVGRNIYNLAVSLFNDKDYELSGWLLSLADCHFVKLDERTYLSKIYKLFTYLEIYTRDELIYEHVKKTFDIYLEHSYLAYHANIETFFNDSLKLYSFIVESLFKKTHQASITRLIEMMQHYMAYINRFKINHAKAVELYLLKVGKLSFYFSVEQNPHKKEEYFKELLNAFKQQVNLSKIYNKDTGYIYNLMLKVTPNLTTDEKLNLADQVILSFDNEKDKVSIQNQLQYLKYKFNLTTSNDDKYQNMIKQDILKFNAIYNNKIKNKPISVNFLLLSEITFKCFEFHKNSHNETEAIEALKQSYFFITLTKRSKIISKIKKVIKDYLSTIRRIEELDTILNNTLIRGRL